MPNEVPADEQSNGSANITLDLLDALHNNSEVSQRRLSSELGIAVGLTNAYLRRCIRKGWIKVKNAPANRYAYYLTPKGFAEKSRLTAGYLSRSLGFYREARNQCDELLAGCSTNGWTKIALYGSGDLAEIAILCAMRHPVTVVGIVEPRLSDNKFLDLKVFQNVLDIKSFDGVLLTEFLRPQSSYDALTKDIEPSSILVPDILKVSKLPVNELEGESSQ